MSYNPQDETFEEAIRSTMPDRQVADMQKVSQDIEKLKRQLDKDSVDILREHLEVCVRSERVRRQVEMLQLLVNQES